MKRLGCLLEKTEKEQRELYEKYTNRVVRYDEEFLPIVSMDKWIAIMRKERKYPDLSDIALRNLIDVGILDFSEKGNFHIHSELCPDFWCNPKLGENKLFFTRREDCDEFLYKVYIKPRKDSEVISVLRDGEYALPDSITTRDWKVIRIKHFPNVEEETIKELERRRLISSLRAGNFSVGRGRKVVKKYFNLKDDWYMYYFASRGIAESFARSFPSKAKLGIIQHQAED